MNYKGILGEEKLLRDKKIMNKRMRWRFQDVNGIVWKQRNRKILIEYITLIDSLLGLWACGQFASSNWRICRWRVTVSTGTSQIKRVVLGTQGWAKFGRALEKVVSSEYIGSSQFLYLLWRHPALGLHRGGVTTLLNSWLIEIPSEEGKFLQ